MIFYPSQSFYNKNTLDKDLMSFFKRIKLKAYKISHVPNILELIFFFNSITIQKQQSIYLKRQLEKKYLRHLPINKENIAPSDRSAGLRIC